jgi:hypothetical protein
VGAHGARARDAGGVGDLRGPSRGACALLGDDPRCGAALGAFVAPLALVRCVRRERNAWVVVVGSLAGTAIVTPSSLAVTAATAAAALMLRVVSPGWEEDVEAKVPPHRDAPEEPYRWSRGAEGAPGSLEPVATVPVTLAYAERVRALTGCSWPS